MGKWMNTMRDRAADLIFSNYLLFYDTVDHYHEKTGASHLGKCTCICIFFTPLSD